MDVVAAVARAFVLSSVTVMLLALINGARWREQDGSRVNCNFENAAGNRNIRCALGIFRGCYRGRVVRFEVSFDLMKLG